MEKYYLSSVTHAQLCAPRQRQMTHVSKLRTKTGSKDFPLINGQFLWIASLQFTVPCLGCINLAAAGFYSHRHVPDDTSSFHDSDRRDICAYPLEVAVLAEVLDQSGPRLAALNRVPQVGKCFDGHIWMAKNILGRTN